MRKGGYYSVVLGEQEICRAVLIGSTDEQVTMRVVRIVDPEFRHFGAKVGDVVDVKRGRVDFVPIDTPRAGTCAMCGSILVNGRCPNAVGSAVHVHK